MTNGIAIYQTKNLSGKINTVYFIAGVYQCGIQRTIHRQDAINFCNSVTDFKKRNRDDELIRAYKIAKAAYSN